jgi:hypothetical protein
MEIKTIKIKVGDGYAVINESDFNPDLHEAFDVAPEAPAKIKAKKPVEVNDAPQS